MTLAEYFIEDKIIVIKQLIQALIFSAVMAAVFVNGKIQLSNRKKNAKITEEDFDISYSETVETKLSINEIHNLISGKSFLKRLKKEETNSIIYGKTKMTIFSCGEKITIHALNDKVKIKSKTLFKIQFLNNKRNIKNVTMLIDTIESNNPSL